MGIEDLYSDYGIEMANEQHRHYRRGWVNVECPYCTGNPGYHMGFNVVGKYYYCFRCKGHPTVLTLSKILGVDYDSASKVAKDYKIYTIGNPFLNVGTEVKQIGVKELRLPSEVSKSLNSKQRQYLIERGFNPNRLVKNYGLMGTGPASIIKTGEGKKLSLKHRIIYPIFWRGKMVSWQSRDFTGKQEIKYITCPMEYEQLHHKHILYCKNGYMPEKVGVCVEGSFDVWRLDDIAMATFGIAYTPTQMRVLSQLKKLFIWYDPDPQAQVQAGILADQLHARGVETTNINTNKDPADLSADEANYIVKQLKLK